jgi:hypothetical protein
MSGPSWCTLAWQKSRRERIDFLKQPFYKDPNPMHGGSALMTCLPPKCSTSYYDHIGFKFQYEYWGTHSDHITRRYAMCGLFDSIETPAYPSLLQHCSHRKVMESAQVPIVR